jgi:hypothetical protein
MYDHLVVDFKKVWIEMDVKVEKITNLLFYLSNFFQTF